MPYNDDVYGLGVASADDVDVCISEFMAVSCIMLEDIGSWCCCMDTVREHRTRCESTRILISRLLATGQSGTWQGRQDFNKITQHKRSLSNC